MRGAEEACQAQGLAFLPLVVESYGGWGEVARDVVRRLATALARQNGRSEDETLSFVWGRLATILYGLLNDLEKAKNSDLWWLADYFFFADWAEDHYGQVSTDSSMSKAGILDCPSTSTSVDAVDPVDNVDDPAPRTSKMKKI